MNSLFKRALILVVFAAGFAIFMITVEALLSTKASPTSSVEKEPSEPATQTDQVQNPFFSLPPAPPAAQPSAIASPEGKTEKVDSSPAADAREDQGSQSLMELFLSGQPSEETEINMEEVEKLLREHVGQNHPGLKLSDADYERLANALKQFRDANLKMRSMERTSSNAPAFRQALEDAAAATKEFREITGMSQGEFFRGESPPVIFGNTQGAIEGKDEIVTDYLSDYKP